MRIKTATITTNYELSGPKNAPVVMLAIASKMFGYKVYPSLTEYQDLYKAGKIGDEFLKRAIARIKGPDYVNSYLTRLFQTGQNPGSEKRIGNLRAHWKDHYRFDLNGRVHVNVFRLLNSYLDQGVALWSFPIHHTTLLEAIRHLEKNSYSGFLRTDHARVLLHDPKTSIKELLKLLVGDESLFEQYVRCGLQSNLDFTRFFGFLYVLRILFTLKEDFFLLKKTISCIVPCA